MTAKGVPHGRFVKLCDKSRRSILNLSQSVDKVLGTASKYTVAIVQPGETQSHRQIIVIIIIIGKLYRTVSETQSALQLKQY